MDRADSSSGSSVIGGQTSPPPSVLPPETLSPIAAEIWSDIVGSIHATRHFLPTDLTGLEILCENYAEWCELKQDIAENGRFYTTIDIAGNTIHRSHPRLAALQDVERRLRGWLAEYGLTPSARYSLNNAARGRPGDLPQIEYSDTIDLTQFTAEERDMLKQIAYQREEAA